MPPNPDEPINFDVKFHLHTVNNIEEPILVTKDNLSR